MDRSVNGPSILTWFSLSYQWQTNFKSSPLMDLNWSQTLKFQNSFYYREIVTHAFTLYDISAYVCNRPKIRNNYNSIIIIWFHHNYPKKWVKGWITINTNKYGIKYALLVHNKCSSWWIFNKILNKNSQRVFYTSTVPVKRCQMRCQDLMRSFWKSWKCMCVFERETTTLISGT